MKKMGSILCSMMIIIVLMFSACGGTEVTTPGVKVEQDALSISSSENAVTSETYILTTKGGSGSGTVSYAIVGGDDIATINDNAITFSDEGQIEVKATKASDDTYLSAESSVYTIDVYEALITASAQEPVSASELAFLDAQREVDSDIASEYSKGSYTMSDPYIDIDPYSINALSALVKFETDKAAQISYKVNGSIPYEMGVSGYRTSHEIPVICLYSNTTNSVTLTATYESGTTATSTISIKTSSVSATGLTIDYEASNVELDDYFMHVSNMGSSYGCWFDTNGALRLKFSLGQFHPEARIDYETGTMLVEHRSSNTGLNTGTSKGIFELDFCGRVVNYYKVPYEMHHDFSLMPNGNLLVDTSGDSVYIEDTIIEIERGTGNIVREWDFKEIMDINRDTVAAGAGTNSAYDWIHLNSVVYDKNTNAIIVSAKEPSAIFSIDYDTDEINWIIAEHVNWDLEDSDFDLTEYLLEPVGDLTDFKWQFGQHSADVTASGNIILFDNDTKDSTSTSTRASRGVEYKVDPVNMTVEQVWEYRGDGQGDDYNGGYYAKNISSVQEFENGNRLIDFGSNTNSSGSSDAKIFEVAVDGADSTLLRKFSMATTVYRAKKVTTPEFIPAVEKNESTVLYDEEYYDNKFTETSSDTNYGRKIYVNLRGEVNGTAINTSNYNIKLVVKNYAGTEKKSTTLSTYSSTDGMYFLMLDMNNWSVDDYTISYTALNSSSVALTNTNTCAQSFSISKQINVSYDKVS